MTEHTEVAILGAGPTGLCAALACAQLGLEAQVLDMRPEPSGAGFPGLDVLHAARLRLLRELGAAEAVLGQAVDLRRDMDATWVSAPSLRQVHRFSYPRPAVPMQGDAPVRITRPRLVSALWRLARNAPGISLRPETQCRALEVRRDGALLRLRSASGAAWRLQVRWLLGCDGARSLARRALEVPMEGPGALGRVRQLHFRTDAPELLWPDTGPSWHTQADRRVLVDEDGDGEYSLHQLLLPDAESLPLPGPREVAEKAVADAAARLLRGFAGLRRPAEVLGLGDWQPCNQVARQGGQGGVWLAGDALHQFAPVGGYGANMGMQDGADMAAALAAVVGGEPPALLWEAAARRAWAARRCLHAALRHLAVRQRIGAAYAKAGGLLESPGARGEAARQKLGRLVAGQGNLENEALDIQDPGCYPGWLRPLAGEGEADFFARVRQRFEDPSGAGLQPDDDAMRGAELRPGGAAEVSGK